MSSHTARKVKRHGEPHETTPIKKPPAAFGDAADAIATRLVPADRQGPRPAKPNSHSMPTGADLDSGARENLVREAAYFRAERRGFAPGGELEDWFAAEREVDQFLAAARVVPVGFFG